MIHDDKSVGHRKKKRFQTVCRSLSSETTRHGYDEIGIITLIILVPPNIAVRSRCSTMTIVFYGYGLQTDEHNGGIYTSVQKTL